MRRAIARAALLASLLAVPALAAPDAGAAPFTVDDPGDAPDATPTALDGQCETATGTCTLRAALHSASGSACAVPMTAPENAAMSPPATSNRHQR